MIDGMLNGEVVRIDIDRLVGRIEALGEIGAVLGPNGERGCARLALTDADRDGRDLVVTSDCGLRSMRSGTSSQPATVLTHRWHQS
jgi:hypothetical protein